MKSRMFRTMNGDLFQVEMIKDDSYNQWFISTSLFTPEEKHISTNNGELLDETTAFNSFVRCVKLVMEAEPEECICLECKQAINKDDRYFVTADKEYVCGDCVEIETAVHCDICESEIHGDYHSINGMNYCDDCLEAK